VNGSADVNLEGGKVVVGDSRSQKDGSVKDSGTEADIACALNVVATDDTRCHRAHVTVCGDARQLASDVGLGRLRRLVDEKVTKVRLGERGRVVGVNGSVPMSQCAETRASLARTSSLKKRATKILTSRSSNAPRRREGNQSAAWREGEGCGGEWIR
jgi:hypothetical protein